MKKSGSTCLFRQSSEGTQSDKAVAEFELEDQAAERFLIDKQRTRPIKGEGIVLTDSTEAISTCRERCTAAAATRSGYLGNAA